MECQALNLGSNFGVRQIDAAQVVGIEKDDSVDSAVSTRIWIQDFGFEDLSDGFGTPCTDSERLRALDVDARLKAPFAQRKRSVLLAVTVWVLEKLKQALGGVCRCYSGQIVDRICAQVFDGIRAQIVEGRHIESRPVVGVLHALIAEAVTSRMVVTTVRVV